MLILLADRMNNKKSQIANEFLVVVGISILVLLIFLSLEAQDFEILGIRKTSHSIDDFGKFLQGEIFTAAEVKDGYIRKINIPVLINGFNYSVANTNDEIILFSTYKNIEFSYIIPNIIGNLTKGENTIKKIGGLVYVN